MRQIWLWTRLVLGTGLGLGIFAGTIGGVLTDTEGRSVLELLTLGIGGVAFAVLAVGWGGKGRYPGAGSLVINTGVAIFSFSMLGFIVMAFPAPTWLKWLVFAIFSVIAGLFLRLRLSTNDNPRRPLALVDGRLVVISDRSRSLLVAGLAVIMFCASLWLVLMGHVVGIVFGGAGFLLFGAATVWALMLCVRPTPVVIADSFGLTDFSLARRRQIAWPDVVELEVDPPHRLVRLRTGDDELLFISLSTAKVDPVQVFMLLEFLRTTPPPPSRFGSSFEGH